MKLRDVLELINSRQTIMVQEEETTFYDETNYNRYDVTHTIQTTMYGNLSGPISENLIERNVKCMFPIKGELWVYLENNNKTPLGDI